MSTGIEWTDETWNPTTGCDRVSPGCENCYAETMAKRLKKMGSPAYQEDGDPRTSGPGFKLQMHEDRLDQPLRWTRPRRIFVDSMSDLFHPDVTDEFLAEVWAVMSMAEEHTFQILTKRHARMRGVVGHPMFKLMVNAARMRRGVPVLPDSRRDDGTYAWPLTNVWLGVSVEDQERADARVPHLLETSAAVRFLSCEPLLGPVDLRLNFRTDRDDMTSPKRRELLHWVIVGGESGPDARPMHPDWVRSLRGQCVDAGVPFFFKQWGAWAPASVVDGGTAAGSAMHSWPETRSSPSVRVGKHAAGRELDGRTWEQFPDTETADA